MKWFKHLSSNSIQDPKLTQLLDALGVEGYGRYFLLLECVVRAADSLDVAPSVTFSRRRWAQILRLKAKNVPAFLVILATFSLIDCASSGNQIVVTLKDWEAILTKSAISSDRRSPTGAPTKEHNQSLRLNRTFDQESQLSEDLANNPALVAATKDDVQLAQTLASVLKKKRVMS